MGQTTSSTSSTSASALPSSDSPSSLTSEYGYSHMSVAVSPNSTGVPFPLTPQPNSTAPEGDAPPPPPSDGYRWRKYGQKSVKGSAYARNYYKCTYPGCTVKKQVDKINNNGKIVDQVLCKGEHCHGPPQITRINAHDQQTFRNSVINESLAHTEIMVKHEDTTALPPQPPRHSYTTTLGNSGGAGASAGGGGGGGAGGGGGVQQTDTPSMYHLPTLAYDSHGQQHHNHRANAQGASSTHTPQPPQAVPLPSYNSTTTTNDTIGTPTITTTSALASFSSNNSNNSNNNNNNSNTNNNLTNTHSCDIANNISDSASSANTNGTTGATNTNTSNTPNIGNHNNNLSLLHPPTPTSLHPSPANSVSSPRLVIETNTSVDCLDDGYHWRKYGQKTVKGSPFPRSYYKCTEKGCPVKKQVEQNGSSIVNTYEGTHTHLAPAMDDNSDLIKKRRLRRSEGQDTGGPSKRLLKSLDDISTSSENKSGTPSPSSDILQSGGSGVSYDNRAHSPMPIGSMGSILHHTSHLHSSMGYLGAPPMSSLIMYSSVDSHTFSTLSSLGSPKSRVDSTALAPLHSFSHTDIPTQQTPTFSSQTTNQYTPNNNIHTHLTQPSGPYLQQNTQNSIPTKFSSSIPTHYQITSLQSTPTHLITQDQ